MSSPQAFISYSNENRKSAAATKAALEALNIDGFLAHEDFNASEEWLDGIKEKLDTADIFVALLSEDFASSIWCAHEVGYIVSREDEVLIIPLALDRTDPEGFIHTLHAKRIHSDDEIKGAIETTLLKKRPQLVLPGIISKVKNAGSYRTAEGVIAPLVPYFSKFTAKDAAAFATAAAGNSQVWDAHLCKTKYLPAFLRDCRAIIPKKLLNEIRGHIEDNPEI
jgi:hypothetical protein